MSQLPSKAGQITKAAPVANQPRATTFKLYYAFKRALDFSFSLLLLGCLSPLLVLVTLAIVVESRGPVLFLQQRLGVGGKKFGLYKFRTLARRPSQDDKRGSVMTLSGKDNDITKVGKFLRNSGLNELPQLLNILRGEMSFVGPRPAVLHHEQYYTDWHKKRLNVRPGVTGLAQVCGRNVIPWGWRVVLDRHYTEHMTFWLDLQILLKTAYVVSCQIGVEGNEDCYFDFEPPTEDILGEFKKHGVMRTFLHKDN